MKIKQVIVDDRSVYVFTDNPVQDVKEYIKNYEDDDYREMELGYEIPQLHKYIFLGEEYPCISLWFDNDAVPDFYINFKS